VCERERARQSERERERVCAREKERDREIERNRNRKRKTERERPEWLRSASTPPLIYECISARYSQQLAYIAPRHVSCLRDAMAMMSWTPTLLGLFCKRALPLQGFFPKEPYICRAFCQKIFTNLGGLLVVAPCHTI